MASGARLVDEKGSPVWLRGASHSGSEYMCISNRGILDGMEEKRWRRSRKTGVESGGGGGSGIGCGCGGGRGIGSGGGSGMELELEVEVEVEVKSGGRSGGGWLRWKFSSFIGDTSAEALASMKAWGINVVRVPMNEQCWLSVNGVNPSFAGENYIKTLENYVRTIRGFDMAVILELHWARAGSDLAIGTSCHDGGEGEEGEREGSGKGEE